MQSGVIGRVFKIYSALEDSNPAPNGYSSGGILPDMSVHNVDEILWLTGRMPRAALAIGSRIYSHALTTCKEDFDDALLYLWFADETVAQVQVSRNHVSGYRVETVIFGQDGQIQVGHFDQKPFEIVVEAFGRRGRKEPLAHRSVRNEGLRTELLEAAVLSDANSVDDGSNGSAINGNLFPDAEESAAAQVVAENDSIAVNDPLAEPPAATDPFDEIDFGSFFDDYLDPGYKSPASESVEKPSFETFLSSPVTLGDHLRSQLSVSIISDEARDAAESIIGNLDEDGYLSASLEEIASIGEHTPEQVEQGLRAVQSLDPAGVGARNLRECLLLQIESVNGRGGVAWQIVSNCLRLMETRQYKEIAKVLGAADGAHRDRRPHDPAPQSAARPALFRCGSARGGTGRFLHQGWRRLHHSDER